MQSKFQRNVSKTVGIAPAAYPTSSFSLLLDGKTRRRSCENDEEVVPEGAKKRTRWQRTLAKPWPWNRDAAHSTEGYIKIYLHKSTKNTWLTGVSKAIRDIILGTPGLLRKVSWLRFRYSAASNPPMLIDSETRDGTGWLAHSPVTAKYNLGSPRKTLLAMTCILSLMDFVMQPFRKIIHRFRLVKRISAIQR